MPSRFVFSGKRDDLRREAAVQQQQRRHEESSWGVMDWLGVADTLFDVGEAVGGVLVDAGAAVIEIAGELLLGLLD